jgi:hypothetical protein
VEEVTVLKPAKAAVPAVPLQAAPPVNKAIFLDKSYLNFVNVLIRLFIREANEQRRL